MTGLVVYKQIIDSYYFFFQVKVSGERSLRQAVPYTAGIRIAFNVKS